MKLYRAIRDSASEHRSIVRLLLFLPLVAAVWAIDLTGLGPYTTVAAPNLRGSADEYVPGTRLFLKELTISEIVDGEYEAWIRVAAAADIRVEFRAVANNGMGAEGAYARTGFQMDEGSQVSFSVPLTGDDPALYYSWVDAYRQYGALVLTGDDLVYPLPRLSTAFCPEIRVQMISTVQAINPYDNAPVVHVLGKLSSSCPLITHDDFVDATISTGHQEVEVTANMPHDIAHIEGQLTVDDLTDAMGGTATSFNPNGTTYFYHKGSVPTKEPLQLSLHFQVDVERHVVMPSVIDLTHFPKAILSFDKTLSLATPSATDRDVTPQKDKDWSCPDEETSGTLYTRRLVARASIAAQTHNETFEFEETVYEEHVAADVQDPAEQPRVRYTPDDGELFMEIGRDRAFELFRLEQLAPGTSPVGVPDHEGYLLGDFGGVG